MATKSAFPMDKSVLEKPLKRIIWEESHEENLDKVSYYENLLCVELSVMFQTQGVRQARIYFQCHIAKQFTFET